MSLSPVLYSTPDGCAYIADKGFDAVWAAVPGNSDPTSIFAATFFPGLVAVQWGQNLYLGVDYDVSTSEFSFDQPTIGGDMAQLDDIQVVLNDVHDLVFYGATERSGEADYEKRLVRIEAAIATLVTPTVDVNALAAALIPHLPAGTDPAVVARDVVDQLAAQLSKP